MYLRRKAGFTAVKLVQSRLPVACWSADTMPLKHLPASMWARQVRAQKQDTMRDDAILIKATCVRRPLHRYDQALPKEVCDDTVTTSMSTRLHVTLQACLGGQLECTCMQLSMAYDSMMQHGSVYVTHMIAHPMFRSGAKASYQQHLTVLSATAEPVRPYSISTCSAMTCRKALLEPSGWGSCAYDRQKCVSTAFFP